MTMLLHIATCENFTGRLFAAFLCLMLLFPSLPAVAANRSGDELLTGFVASILERDLNRERDSYTLKIINGVATITLYKEDPIRQEAADKQLRAIDGPKGVTIVVKPADDVKPEAEGSFMGVTAQGETFPVGDLFWPIIADPKQPRFFVSVLDLNS